MKPNSLIKSLIWLIFLGCIGTTVWIIGDSAVKSQSSRLSMDEDRNAQIQLLDRVPKPKRNKKSEPIVFSLRTDIPEMAKAKTGVNLTTTWSCTLVMDDWGLGDNDNPVVDYISATCLGGSATLTYISGQPGPPYESHPVGEIWNGVYNLYRLTVSVGAGPGAVTDSMYFWIWFHDRKGTPGLPLDPAVPVYTGDIACPVTATTSGVYLKGESTTNTLTDRQLMDFTDKSATHTWYADEDSTVTINATGPGDVQVSASGALAEAGTEFELGSTVHLWTAFSLEQLPVVETCYAAVSDITFNGMSPRFTNLDLWYSSSEQPSDRAPFQYSANDKHWSRYEEDSASTKLHVYDYDNGPGIKRDSDSSGSSNALFTAVINAPYKVNFKFVTGKFSDENAYPDMGIVLPIRVWAYDEEEEEWDYTYKVVYADETVTHYPVSWEFLWEYHYLDVPLWGREDTTWRTDNDEDVGTSSDPDENDRTLGILIPPINRDSMEGTPWWGMEIVPIRHRDYVEVNAPEGLRPSEWVGASGVNVTDYDVLTVGDGIVDPYVERTLKTRYFWRMDRLAARQETPTYQYEYWPIMLRRAKAVETYSTWQDDPDWWDPEQGGIEYEDVYNWENYSYLSIDLIAPVSGTVTLTVNYSVVTVSDPCYTCYEHRFGAEGEWEYTRTQRTVTYQLDVLQGAGQYLIDLWLNNEGYKIIDSYRMMHVDSIRLTFPTNSSGDNQVWELSDMRLVEDEGDSERTAPLSHIEYRFRRDYDWIDSHWLGFGFVVDGKPCMQLDPGYSYVRYERGLPYIQKRAHCPDSELTDRLDYAVSLSTLAWIMSFQEGWDQTDYPTSPTPEESAYNMDEDDNKLASTLYGWDFCHCQLERFDTSDPLGRSDNDGCVCVGQWLIPAGIPVDVYLTKYPQGMVHGIATDEGFTERVRNDGTSYLYGLRDGTDHGLTQYNSPSGKEYYNLLSIDTTDAHGRFRHNPVWENHWIYGLSDEELSAISPETGIVASQLDVTGLSVANREYTFSAQTLPLGPWLVAAETDAGIHMLTAVGKLLRSSRCDCGRSFEAPAVVNVRGKNPSFSFDMETNQSYLSVGSGLITRLYKSLGDVHNFISTHVMTTPYSNGQHVLIDGVVYVGGYGSSHDIDRVFAKYGRALSSSQIAEAGKNDPISLMSNSQYGYILAAIPQDDDTTWIYKSYDDSATWSKITEIYGQNGQLFLADDWYGVVVYISEGSWQGSLGTLRLTRFNSRNHSTITGTSVFVGQADFRKCSALWYSRDRTIRVFAVKRNTWNTENRAVFGTYSSGRINTFEGIPCKGICIDFARRYWEWRVGGKCPVTWDSKYRPTPIGSIADDWHETSNWPSGAQLVDYTGSNSPTVNDAVMMLVNGSHVSPHIAIYAGDVGETQMCADSNRYGEGLGYYGPLLTEGYTIDSWFTPRRKPAIVEFVSYNDGDTFHFERILPQSV